ncbi:ANTAR domain-containing protein [Geodermatophilus africanus]|uniref:ANTAR domain-containing protein n=1 Tax=Geodermatophilus africanus TaxID=1137993 RepID=A0A1H3EIE3_9ACTN|nr:ANTAR domain-containing protein [Geodermatophilus africanus]SDX78516.1 ANTAR domain-containing protein [Geodermatophilus africanus]
MTDDSTVTGERPTVPDPTAADRQAAPGPSRDAETAVGTRQRAGGPAAVELAALRTRAEAAEDRADNLERALLTNRRIGMAIGILLERLRVTEEQAFDVLRRESMRQNVRLAQVAEQVVYTGTL